MTAHPRVLCVDDERSVLDGLTRVLRRDFELVTAQGGAEALRLMANDGKFAVVMSDMRMPGVDGVQVLSAARRFIPDATRVLLTGHADLRAAVLAVNEGRIFRFLTKPCAPAELLATLAASAEQHRIVCAERLLLEQTLHGSVQALVQFLALAQPAVFGRAERLKRLIGDLAAMIGFRDRWQMEMAALLSQLGCVALPPGLLERHYRGERLTAEEQEQVTRLPEVAVRLLAGIPKLDEIREILEHVNDRFTPLPHVPQAVVGDEIPLGARMLRAILDFDLLRSQGVGAADALARLRAHEGWYDVAVLSDLATVTGAEGGQEIRELPLQQVELGMVFVDDVRAPDGTLLVARGQEVTPSLLERVEDYWSALTLPPVRVTLERARATERA